MKEREQIQKERHREGDGETEVEMLTRGGPQQTSCRLTGTPNMAPLHTSNLLTCHPPIIKNYDKSFNRFAHAKRVLSVGKAMKWSNM